jgi:hypothetical protein
VPRTAGVSARLGLGGPHTVAVIRDRHGPMAAAGAGPHAPCQPSPPNYRGDGPKSPLSRIPSDHAGRCDRGRHRRYKLHQPRVIQQARVSDEFLVLAAYCLRAGTVREPCPPEHARCDSRWRVFDSRVGVKEESRPDPRHPQRPLEVVNARHVLAHRSDTLDDASAYTQIHCGKCCPRAATARGQPLGKPRVIVRRGPVAARWHHDSTGHGIPTLRMALLRARDPVSCQHAVAVHDNERVTGRGGDSGVVSGARWARREVFQHSYRWVVRQRDAGMAGNQNLANAFGSHLGKDRLHRGRDGG